MSLEKEKEEEKVETQLENVKLDEDTKNSDKR